MSNSFSRRLFTASYRAFLFSGLTLLAGVLSAKPVPDVSPDRADTPLDPGLVRVGTLHPRGANEISGSNWTLGCEVLDRDFAIWDEYKDFIVPLGIKTIRFQGGWAKTEKVKGVYDFAWLDKLIDDARARGLNVLLETDYGNPVYVGGGGWDLGAGFPSSEEGLAAWDRWVGAMATRYKGRVRDWAMWNEPDIGKGKTPESIAAFNIRTAEIIKRIIPDARIAGLSLASNNARLLEKCLKVIDEKGKIGLFDWFIYHGYSMNPDHSYRGVEAQKAVLSKYSATARMRQGENGCPSEETHRFALPKYPWTEISQAKWDLRRMLGDLGHDVQSSIFTICDFNHKGREINRKGLLRANEDRRVIGVKRAYYAVQNLVSVFDDSLIRRTDPCVSVMAERSLSHFVYTHKPSGAAAVVFWEDGDVPSESFTTRSAHFTFRGISFREPVWVDLMSGRIYAVPENRIFRAGAFTLVTDLPIYDAPVVLTEKALVLK